MNVSLVLPLSVTTVVAILSWYVAHQFSAARDRENKRREQRVQYLIEAYRKLEAASNREQPIYLYPQPLESALADIQLFGSLSQITLVRKFAQDFAATGEGSTDELLLDLRRDLRRELRLDPVPERLLHLRILPTESDRNKPKTGTPPGQ